MFSVPGLSLHRSRKPGSDPKKLKQIQRECEKLTLYYFPGCPFCQVTLARARRMGLTLPRKNIHRDPDAMHELIEGGGKKTVPCLRIRGSEGIQWLYESTDIIRYLESRFAD